MRIHQVFNPFFIYSKRDRIVPYLSRHRDQLVDLRKLWPFKDKHRGERCFVIGNGPSLAIRDLERLRSEITFAANKIYLAFDKTDWRPSYYVLEDDHIIHLTIQRGHARPDLRAGNGPRLATKLKALLKRSGL